MYFAQELRVFPERHFADGEAEPHRLLEHQAGDVLRGRIHGDHNHRFPLFAQERQVRVLGMQDRAMIEVIVDHTSAAIS